MLKLIMVICIFVSLGFSQQGNAKRQASKNEGEEIIQKARQVIGLDKGGEISSYFYKLKTTLVSQDRNLESSEEVSLILPGKIQAIYGSDSPIFSRLTRTWNGEKYKSIFESQFPSGQRTVKDVTSEENKPLSKNVSNVIGKEKTAALQDFQKVDPKYIFTESLWTSLFPLILSHPFEKNIEFKYVGKAKSNDKTANVVDVKPSDGKTYRLLFDSETNYLLMMIVSHKETNERFVGDVEEKYYFSERELINGVLIPKKIKVEKKATPTRKDPIIGFSNIEILDFKLNPQLDEKIFNIK